MGVGCGQGLGVGVQSRCSPHSPLSPSASRSAAKLGNRHRQAMRLSLQTQVGSQSSRCTRTAQPRAPTLSGLSGQRTRTAMHPSAARRLLLLQRTAWDSLNSGPPTPPRPPLTPRQVQSLQLSDKAHRGPLLRPAPCHSPLSLRQVPFRSPRSRSCSPPTACPALPKSFARSASPRVRSCKADFHPPSTERATWKGTWGGKQEGPASCGTGPCHPTPPGHPAQRQNPDAFLQTFYTEVISRAPLGPQAP